MEKYGSEAYLVNTGWNGTGKRISIKDTRAIIDAILDGSIEKSKTKIIPVFNLEVPTFLHDVDPKVLIQEKLILTQMIGKLKLKN